jgi:ABC-type antimicrobial peptide transport system permease subunit
MALGGTPAGVVRLVLGRVAWLVGSGVLLGLGGGYWAARFVRALMFGLDARDPLTFAAAAVLLVVTGLMAGALPAWRASRADPTLALKSD